MRDGRPMRAVCILMAILAGVISRVPVSAQMDEGLVKAAARQGRHVRRLASSVSGGAVRDRHCRG
jgi:hypothetical protein